MDGRTQHRLQRCRFPAEEERAPPPPLTETDQAAIAASTFRVNIHPHPLTLYLHANIYRSQCAACLKRITGRVYSRHPCSDGLHPACFAVAGGIDAWNREHPDPVVRKKHGLILFDLHDRKLFQSRTDVPLLQLQARTPCARWCLSRDSRFGVGLPQHGSLAPLPWAVDDDTTAILNRLATDSDVRPGQRAIAADVIAQKFRLLHRLEAQRLRLHVLVTSPLSDTEQRDHERHRDRSPPTCESPLRHLSILGPTTLEIDMECELAGRARRRRAQRLDQ
jgi:hypothetical protein